jgi:hypothetical protein
VLFVYKKTILEILYNAEDENAQRVENIMSLNEETNEEGDSIELNRFFHILSSFTTTFFFRNSRIIEYGDRCLLAKRHLKRLGKNIECLPFIECGLKIIQDKFTMDMTMYDNLLNEIVEKLSTRKQEISPGNMNEHFLLRLMDSSFIEKWEEGIPTFAGWFYGI